MKQLVKKLLVVMSVFGMVAVLGGCYDKTGTTKSHGVEYVRTHQKGDIQNAHAKIYQTYGAKERLGTIKFHEVDAGLTLEIALEHLRPGVEYKLCVHDRNGKKTGIELPTIKGTADGKIDNTYIVQGISAAQLVDNKIVLERDGDVKAGAGKVEKGISLF